MPCRPGFLLCTALGLTIGTFAWNSQGAQEQPRVAIQPRQRETLVTRTSPNIRADVRLVLIPVTVTDALDRPFNTLKRENFSVWEDGVEQPLAHFSQEEGPVSLGLLFDS